MKLWKEDINGTITFGYAETAPNVNCVDVTNSIESWYSATNIIDFYGRQRRIKALIIAIVQPDFSLWNNLSQIEKDIAIEMIVAPYSLRVPTVTDEQDKQNWDKLVIESEGNPFEIIQGRAKIYQFMRIIVSDYVRKEIWNPGDYLFNLSKAQAFFRDVQHMKEYYIAANDPELSDFLNTTGMHLLTGFRTKDYWLQSLENELLEIFNNY